MHRSGEIGPRIDISGKPDGNISINNFGHDSATHSQLCELLDHRRRLAWLDRFYDDRPGHDLSILDDADPVLWVWLGCCLIGGLNSWQHGRIEIAILLLAIPLIIFCRWILGYFAAIPGVGRVLDCGQLAECN